MGPVLRMKLKILANAFCPTGSGGGQDNSCGAGGSGSDSGRSSIGEGGVHTSPSTPELTFHPDNLNAHLKSGGVIQVTTQGGKSTLYDSKHAGHFSMGKDGIYVKHGKGKNYLGPAKRPWVSIRLGRQMKKNDGET